MHYFFKQRWPTVRLTVLSLLYCVSLSPLLAHAADKDTVFHEDHNHHRLLNLLDQDDTYHGLLYNARDYEPGFAGLDRGIIGRAPAAFTELNNNAPKPTDIDQGDIQYWNFPKEVLQGPPGKLDFNLPLNLTTSHINADYLSGFERNLIKLAPTANRTGDDRIVWLTISTCDQPRSRSTDHTGAPPQLEVYISRSASNQRPDNERNNQVMEVDRGYGTLTITDVTDDLWIGVRAPTVDNFDGVYNYELAASTDAQYATYFEADDPFWDPQIALWDTDKNSSILATGNVTNEPPDSPNFTAWLKQEPPFSIYVHNQADTAIAGLQRSICGLKNRAQRNESDKHMITIGGRPKQLFYVKGLNGTSTYDAIMTYQPSSSSSTVGGGGAVWKQISFTTKSDINCQIIHSLSFCTDVAYAVPANPSFAASVADLALTYDTYANDSYQNFSKSLQQIPCETTPSAQYSLARTCTDCDNAYKAWLCAVTIPRCADLSSPDHMPHLIPRNLNASVFVNGTTVPTGPPGSLFSQDNKHAPHYQASRNTMVDEKIKPGPYKEMLPCKDLCYHLIQNCPAALQFACPAEDRGLNYSYGHYSKGDQEWKCNWPGGRLVNEAGHQGLDWKAFGVLLVAVLYVS